MLLHDEIIQGIQYQMNSKLENLLTWCGIIYLISRFSSIVEQNLFLLQIENVEDTLADTVGI